MSCLCAMASTARYRISTSGQGDVRDLTREAQTAVAESGCETGIATIAVVGSTAAVMTIEYEPGAVADFTRLLEQLAPRDGAYDHHARWGDDNGSSHVRAALLGPSVTLPIAAGQLTLGTWQQLVLVECDTRARTREVVVQILGD